MKLVDIIDSRGLLLCRVACLVPFGGHFLLLPFVDRMVDRMGVSHVVASLSHVVVSICCD